MCASSPCGWEKQGQRLEPGMHLGGFHTGGRAGGEPGETDHPLLLWAPNLSGTSPSLLCKHFPASPSISQTSPVLSASPGGCTKQLQTTVTPSCHRQRGSTPCPVLYLHPCLYHVQGGVAKDTCGSGEGSKHPRDEWVDDFVGIIPWEGGEVLGRVVVWG